MLYTYYATVRPVAPGTVPMNGLEQIDNFDSRRNVGYCMAWARIYYSRPLIEQEKTNYELSENKPVYKSIIIPDLHDLCIASFRGNTIAEEKYKDANDLRKKTYKRLFEMLIDGEIDIFYYDQFKKTDTDFTRYIFTRSTKISGMVQKSCLQYIDEKIIPTSDSNRESWRDFERENAFPDNVTIYYGSV